MSSTHASCLCGEVAWTIDGPLQFMSHCHCSRCRKAHGAAFGTYVMCSPDQFRFERGRDRVVAWESSPGFSRPFCGKCGSVVPDGVPYQGLIASPAGPFDDDPEVRPIAHIFVASKAPWYEVHGDIPQFDAYPPGIDATILPDRAPLGRADGKLRGSCLCGAVTYEVEGEPMRCWNCHCSRCRKARSAAHATNLFVHADGTRFTRGEDNLSSFKPPEAERFTQVFCRTCGSPMPRIDRVRGFAVVPMGSLDDDPGMRPSRHIFTGSKAPWYDIADDLPQDVELPTA